LEFTDPEAWNDIYWMQVGRVQNPKDPFAYTPQVPGFDSNIIHAPDTKHARLRRIYGQAFTPKAVEEQAAMVVKYAYLLVIQLKAAVQKNPVQDMSAWNNCTTFDFMGDFAFGEVYHCLGRGGKYHFLLETLFERRAWISDAADWIVWASVAGEASDTEVIREAERGYGSVHRRARLSAFQALLRPCKDGCVQLSAIK
jgi:cytochrome P450